MSSVTVSSGQLQKTFVLVTYLAKEDMDRFTRFVILVI